jgi:ribonuclease P/MRP protein subunit RPP40
MLYFVSWPIDIDMSWKYNKVTRRANYDANNPHHVVTVSIKLLESVQRKFTKRLPGYSLVSYQDRLKQLNLEGLELRRLRIDLSYIYKILFGLIYVNASDFFTLANNDHNTRGHVYKLSTHCSRLDIRKFYFSERVVKPWNNLRRP